MKKFKVEQVALVALSILILVVAVNYLTGRSQNATSTSAAQDAVALSETEILQKFDLIGDGYHLLYEELALPNTLQQVEPPVITGSDAADEHIRQLAEARGYHLRQVAASEDELQQVDGQLAQAALRRDWLKLRAAAKKQGISVAVRSGYRSVQDQRRLFVDRLAATGVVTSQIASGSQDAAVQEALRLVAPPGYSRHHSGYTIDVSSADHGTFSLSQGFKWMSKNNYANTLKYGFIPSYPVGAEEQGPEPENWEFVWVGTDLIESQLDS